MKFLKDAKSTKPRTRRISNRAIKDMDEVILSQIYDKCAYKTYSFPHGDLNIAQAELGRFITLLPVEIQLIYQEDIEERILDIPWLLEKKKTYPQYPAFYYRLIDCYKDQDDIESWCATMLEFNENCPKTPLSLYEEMYYNEQNENKTSEQFNAMYLQRITNLHTFYPDRKFFYMDEIMDIMGVFVNMAIQNNQFEIAQQYIDTVNSIIGEENVELTKKWVLNLMIAKQPRWKKILFPVLIYSAVLSCIGFVLWLIYKAAAWIWSLF
jgi:hypothetical protein